MKIKNTWRRGFLAAAGIALAMVGADRCVGQNLVAHWKLDETNSPYADFGSNNIPLVLDTNTAYAGNVLGADGLAAHLRWSDPPGTSTRLSATDTNLQTDTFGFSFWVRAGYINPFDNLLVKEMAYDSVNAPNPNFDTMAWQVHMIGDNGSGGAPIEFIVRGADRTLGDFYGVVVSSNTLPLQTESSAWVHVAGSYDFYTGQLKLFVDGSESTGIGSGGAYSSDGSPLSIGTGLYNTNFFTFAAGAFIDDLQMYDGTLNSTNVAWLRNHPGQALGETVPVSTSENLIAHWKLEEIAGSSFSDSSGNGVLLLKDADTTPPSSGSGVDGLCSFLYLDTNSAPVSSRLYATNSMLQQDSFGFSLWLNPYEINAGDNVLLKEMPLDTDINHLDFTKLAWQLHVLDDPDTNGYAPLELIVRGDDRGQGDFFGVVASADVIPLGTNPAPAFIHVAGGYDADTGELRLFVDGDASLTGNSSAGANNSGGAPLSLGTAKNGTNFQFFAATAYVDDVQIYAAPLSPTDVEYLMANPGMTLPAPPSPLQITAFSFNAGTGDASLTFDSISGTNYTVQAATAITSTFTGVTNVTAVGASTSVPLSKALIDAALGSSPRPELYLRVRQP